MRRICIVILTSVIAAAFTRAQDDVPAPPRIMQIHLKDGSIDSLLCDQIDPAFGIMFERYEVQGYSERKMKVTFLLVDDALRPIQTGVDPSGNPIFKTDTRYYLPSLIDSITFPLYIPPGTPAQ